MIFRSWQALLRNPSASERHIVQVYREPSFVREAVAEWALPALESGGGAILLGRAERTDAILRRLRAEGLGVDALRARGRLVVVEAGEILPYVVTRGVVDEDAFRSLVGGMLRGVRAACGPGGREIRAWGELVEVLRRRGEAPAAMRLEELWNEVIDAEGLRLLCSYEVDERAGAMADMCAGHSQLILEGAPPAEPALVALHLGA